MIVTRSIIAAAAAMVLLAASDATAACTISTTSVAFGQYNVFNATPTDSTGSITFLCSNADRNIRVSLDQGSSGTFFPRTMRKGGESLPYNLYQNASRTMVWGNGSGGTSQYTNNRPRNEMITLTIYGRIPADADVSAGTYTDTVVATIDW